MLDRDKLQKILRNHKSINIIDLASLMDMNVNDLIIDIKEVMDEYSTWFKRTAWKIPLLKRDKIKEYFSLQIVDLGMLCQNRIKDFKKSVKKKHAGIVYLAYGKKWFLNRGY